MAAPGNNSGSPSVSNVPRLDTRLVDELGIITPPWHRFLIDLWRKVGNGVSSPTTAVYLVYSAILGTISAYLAQNGTLLGQIFVLPVTPQPPQPVNPGPISPFVYTATQYGTILVDSGKVEFQRQASGFVGNFLTGGFFFLAPKDSIRITWFEGAPNVYFYPSF